MDEATIQAVWEKGYVIDNFDPDVWRRDVYSNTIRREDYGNRDSEYGWEIDHIIPVARGGTDALYNLRPLQWRANAVRQ